MVARWEFYNGSRLQVQLVMAGDRFDHLCDPEPLDVHAVLMHDEEVAVLTGTKADLRRLLRRLWAAVDALPDDQPDGSATPSPYHRDRKDTSMTGQEHRTPRYGHFGDPPCEDCGAPGGFGCRPHYPSEGDPFTGPSPASPWPPDTLGQQDPAKR
ncbi:hypothetical protein AGRA3207_007514 [Actinomadura graeca]|uniref:Uncharacterized protein n=1 Tax=Actinomadura graeca TaxID=2750812 RepID=A0ABX8R4D8_9ACTN|nr:hypothetical protein [Actinomadura graeca]QXJ25945.1 hypothetical protein AGRA3207_007514 [Actinomadura graeca]